MAKQKQGQIYWQLHFLLNENCLQPTGNIYISAVSIDLIKITLAADRPVRGAARHQCVSAVSSLAPSSLTLDSTKNVWRRTLSALVNTLSFVCNNLY